MLPVHFAKALGKNTQVVFVQTFVGSNQVLFGGNSSAVSSSGIGLEFTRAESCIYKSRWPVPNWDSRTGQNSIRPEMDDRKQNVKKGKFSLDNNE